jgi:signal transduction histidine kinase/DNA-binding response OmpR family regulator
MSKKPLHSRLDALFQQLNSPQENGSIPGQSVSDDDMAQGWGFTCQVDGTCVACSPEITYWLGLTLGQVIGNSVFKSFLPAELSSRIQAWLGSNTPSFEEEFTWTGQEGQTFVLRLTAHRLGETGQSDPHWRGYVQVLNGTPGSSRSSLHQSPSPHGSSSPSHRPSHLDVTTQPVARAVKTTLPTPPSLGQRAPEVKTPLKQRPHVQPARLTAPLTLPGFGEGLLEVIDEVPDRIWTEDEILLVEEVMRQLSLAIENAQLYAAVQQELAERTRAEQELLRRNQQLALLNEIGQQISRLTEADEILDLVPHAVGQIADNTNLILALYDEKSNLVRFPLVIQDGKFQEWPARPPSREDVIGRVILERRPLWLSRDLEQEVQSLGLLLPEPHPKALIALPMSTGERVLGALVVQSFTSDNAYTRVQYELLSTLVTQLSISLQNANLFQEVMAGLRAIETRERYQAAVARAVALLSESGLKALRDVLSLLGEAAQCDHVFYATVKEDEQGLYWTAVADWSKQETEFHLERNKLQHMPVALFPSWGRPLRERGWFAATLEDLEPFEQNFLRNLNTTSILLLAVPGKAAVPGFLAFEQATPRHWQNDEINILRLAADAVANTLVRQDLLEQLQASLDETENLYHLSTRMSTAATLQEMVAVIPQGMRIPAINRAVLLLKESDTSSGKEYLRVVANWHSGRGTPPPPVDTVYGTNHPYYHLTHTRTPQFYEDVLEQITDPAMRQQLLDLSVRALAALPLWASREQLGALLLLCDEPHHFSGRELRTYPPLAGQMATEVENLRLFEQTQKALARTELLYTISNGIAQAREIQELADLLFQHALPATAENLAIILVNRTPEGEATTLEVAGFCSKNAALQRQGMVLPVQALPSLTQLRYEPWILTHLEQSGLDSTSRNTLQSLGFVSGCIVPLISGERLLGLLTVSASRPMTLSSEDIQILQAAGNGITVAIERFSLLREAQRRALQLETAAQIARDTLSTLDLNTLLGRMVQLVAQRFNYYHVGIYLSNDENSHLVLREAAGAGRDDLLNNPPRYARGSRTPIGRVATVGEPLVLNRVLEDPFYQPNPYLPHTRSEVILPLKTGDNVMGVLDIHARNESAFTSEDLHVLQILADQIAVAIENARAYELAQQAVEEMRRADRLKSQFLANMSHELRTPLNSIIGFSKVILKGIDGPITELQRQDLTSIYNSGQHLLGLINDILDLSKIEAGKMELQFSEVNLVDLINSVMSTAVGLVKDKPITLYHHVPADLPTVIADATRIRQVLLNFLSNAAKFTEEGSITVEAKVVESPKGTPEVMITVTDTGIGVAEEDRHKLFQPFSQVDDSPTRRTGGTGLGLSICRSFVEMHGGRIGLLWSEVGKGSTFFFTLPVPTPTTAQSGETMSALPDGAPVILAIDDDHQVTQLYQRYLENNGYRIVPLHDPHQAVATAKRLKPFAITLDLMMPDKDGWQVLFDLKNDPETRDIPVIICSILEEEEKGFSLGAADYLVKPFLPEDLIHALYRLKNGGSEPKILIVDDSAEDVRLLQKILDADGRFHIQVAYDGQAALEHLAQSSPDVILLDLFMPGMDGFQVLEALRTHPIWSRIPVIIITGGDLTPEQREQLAEFSKRMLNKSQFHEKDLFALLESALQKWSKNTPSSH